MKWTSILAIYILFWTLALFLVLPFGVRTPEEEGTKAGAGHAESAPHRFNLGKVAIRASLVAAVLTGLYVRQLHVRLDPGRGSGLAEPLTRHCERSEAIQYAWSLMDCFVARLLAMTAAAVISAAARSPGPAQRRACPCRRRAG